MLLLATLAYLALTHELEKLARKNLESKMEQIQHSLALGLDAHAIRARPHSLMDLVIGHDNFHLTIVGTAPDNSVLLNVGSKPQEPLLTSPTSSHGKPWATSIGSTATATRYSVPPA